MQQFIKLEKHAILWQQHTQLTTFQHWNHMNAAIIAAKVGVGTAPSLAGLAELKLSHKTERNIGPHYSCGAHSLVVFLEDLPVQGVSDSFRHLHHLGTSVSNRTKSSPPPLYLPSACFRQDVFILRRYHLTSSYSVSTAEPREGDLDPTCAASTDLSGGLALRDFCCQGFGNESSSIPSSLVKLAGWTTCSCGRERVWE